jgi:hypothetical protein
MHHVPSPQSRSTRKSGSTRRYSSPQTLLPGGIMGAQCVRVSAEPFPSRTAQSFRSGSLPVVHTLAVRAPGRRRHKLWPPVHHDREAGEATDTPCTSALMHTLIGWLAVLFQSINKMSKGGLPPCLKFATRGDQIRSVSVLNPLRSDEGNSVTCTSAIIRSVNINAGQNLHLTVH